MVYKSSLRQEATGGTVTEINTGTGLTGGPITTTGTISVANSTANSLAGYSGLGVFSTVTVGSGLSLSAGTLTASGAVSSVSNSDGTLTISPTTGSVVASLALGHANTWTGQQTFSTAAPVFGTMTLGSVLFAGTAGILSQDNANFFWDDTNNRLGIGTASPSAVLHSLGTTEQLRVGYNTSNYYSTTVGATGSVVFDAVGSGAGFTFLDAVLINANAGLNIKYAGITVLQTTNGATSGGVLIDNKWDSSWIPLQVRGASAQSASLQEWRDSSNTVLASMSSTGGLTAAGASAIQSVTVGRGPGAVATNTAMGYQVLNSNTTGYNMTAFGYQALYSHVNGGDDNVAVGYRSLYTNNSYSNTGVGADTLRLAIGFSNTAVGYQAGGRIVTGNNNVFLGQSTGYSLTNSGSGNTLVGVAILGGSTASGDVSNITAMGLAALNLSTGVSNNAFGYQAARHLTTGNSNTYIGAFTGTGFETANNRIMLSDGDGELRVHIDNEGDMGLGTGTGTVSARIHAIKTTEQMRLGYDASNYYTTTVGSTGGVTFGAVGSGAGFTFSDDVSVPDEAYGSGWNGSLEAPTKNAVYDKIEAIAPIAGSFSGVGTATTTFTVTIGTTMANTTYKVNATPTAVLSAAFFYITNKTTTTFDVVYLAGLTGTVTFDWAVFP